MPHVEAEVINETPKKEKKEATGFPSRKVMITIAEKHYPKDSDNYKKLLETFNAKSIEDMTDDQLKAVYSKFGGRLWTLPGESVKFHETISPGNL